MHPPVVEGYLPAELASFLGRENDVARVSQALDHERLVTVSGVGGIGKTRVAIRVARTIAAARRDGIVFVDLAPLSTTDNLNVAIHTALGGSQGSADPTRALINRIAGQDLLIVLDNCEHVSDQAATVVESILRGCPNVHILTTSRKPLGITAEFVWRLPPLPLPSAGNAASFEALSANPSAALFLDRARRVQPDLADTAEGVDSIVRICRALDGIPLAIELAAARLRMFSLAQLADRIELKQPFLVSGSRVRPEGQRTMQSTIGWSHDQLNEAERILFRRLGAFSGGWTLEAAEGICSRDGVETEDVLDLLDSLVDCSLVVADASGEETRFRYLSPVLEYARAELVASGEAAAVGARHCRWMAAFINLARPHLVGPAETFWGDRIERDHDNLLGALAWAESHRPELDLGLQMVDLHWFWIRQGRFWEGLTWSRRLLAVDGAAFPNSRIGALLIAAWYSSVVETPDVGRTYVAEAIELAQGAGDQSLIVNALRVQARVSSITGDYEQARTSAREALDLAQGIQDSALPLVELGLELSFAEMECGNFVASERAQQEALSAATAGGSARQQAQALMHVGDTLRVREELARAEEAYRDSLRLATKAGFVRLISTVTINLGSVRLLQHDFTGARILFRAALAQGVHRNEPDVVSPALLGLAALEAEDGDPLRAARWLGVVTSESASFKFSLMEQPVLEHAHGALRQKLGNGFHSQVEVGRGPNLIEAAHEALALADSSASPATTAPSILSAREAEVLRLLAAAMSNRDISESLVLSIRTVETHVANIYSKLGAKSRVEAVRFAIEAGLVTL